MRIQGVGLYLFIVYPATKSPLDELESRTLTLSGVDQLPERLTYKQAYQIKGVSQEGPLFSQFYGQFGIADVIGYHECGPEDPHGSMRRLSIDAEFWDIFGKQDLPAGESHGPEERVLTCIALDGEGMALVDLRNEAGGTPSPSELLESILHAIIGKWCSFCASLFSHVCRPRSLQSIQ